MRLSIIVAKLHFLFHIHVTHPIYIVDVVAPIAEIAPRSPNFAFRIETGYGNINR